MRTVALQDRQTRNDLFRRTAERKHLTTGVVEKDFWVCWTLDYLFDRSPFKKNLGFKGGTSLSKAYDLIGRMSEDIDLVLDWRVLGYDSEAPFIQTSGKQEKKLQKEMVERRDEYIKQTVLPTLQSEASELLTDTVELSLSREPGTILFEYPKSFDDSSLEQRIRLEIGHRSAMMPREPHAITSYAAEEYPDVFSKASTSVQTIAARRTFWEKAVILHKEAHRVNGSIPQRYSRHYYDVYKIAESPIGAEALKDIDLLKDVVSFNKLFFPSAWAQFDLAVPKTISLLPPDAALPNLEADYRNMRNMFYVDPPALATIMERIGELESQIRAL